MTTRQTNRGDKEQSPYFILPDPPEWEPITSFEHLTKNGSVHHLIHHFGKHETTIVAGERFWIGSVNISGAKWRTPNLIVAFDVYPDLYRREQWYDITQQGKPPDFVMEIESRRTGRGEPLLSRMDYAVLGVLEYWRFDGTGEIHGVNLAGDRLVDGAYEAIPVETVEEGVLQGFSAVLNLYVRWERGELRWHDPATGREIPTFEQERDARLHAEEALLAAEARVRELEEELARRNAGPQ